MEYLDSYGFQQHMSLDHVYRFHCCYDYVQLSLKLDYLVHILLIMCKLDI